MNKRKKKFQYSEPEIINSLNQKSNSKGKEKIDYYRNENKIFTKNQENIQTKRKEKNKQIIRFYTSYKIKDKIKKYN